MAFQGIDIRQSGDRLLLRALLLDADGSPVSTGTTELRIMELQADGTVKWYDFADDTFKNTQPTDDEAAMTHRTFLDDGGASQDTGVWTSVLTTLTGFTTGNIYVALVDNANASPTRQGREFQYAGAQGVADGLGLDEAIKVILAAVAGESEVTSGQVVFKDRDGQTVLTVEHDTSGNRTSSVLT